MSFKLNFPATPGTDEIYVSDAGVNYQWDGNKWTTRTISRNTSLGGNPGIQPPLGAVIGDFWYDTVEKTLYIALDAGANQIQWEKTSLRDSPNAALLP